jgi:uncharacterized membrane protein YfhO
LVSWNGAVAEVEHDGPCDLVIARTFDSGWLADMGGGNEQRVLPVDGGLMAVRIEGSGTDRVRLRYQPPHFAMWLSISVLAAVSAAVTLIGSVVSAFRSRPPLVGSASVTG